MDFYTVCRAFAMMAQIPFEEATANDGLIRTAIQLVEDRLQPEADCEKYADLLCRLAAAEASYDYWVLHANCGGTQTFKTGEVTLSIDTEEALRAAKALRDEYRKKAAALLQDDGFLFCAVG